MSAFCLDVEFYLNMFPAFAPTFLASPHLLHTSSLQEVAHQAVCQYPAPAHDPLRRPRTAPQGGRCGRCGRCGVIKLHAGTPA